MDSSKIGYLSMFFAILGWGFSTSFIEFGLRDISPISFLFFRFLITAVVMGVVLLPKRWRNVLNLLKKKTVWIVGISESAGLLFQYLSFSFDVTAGLASLLSLLFLVFVPFLSFFVFGEKIRLKHMFAVFIALFGVYLISTEGRGLNLMSNSLTGTVLLLLSAFSYGVYVVYSSKLSTIEVENIDVFSLFYSIVLIISALSFFGSLLFEDINPPTPNTWFWLFLIIGVSTILPFIAYFQAIKIIPANLASILLLGQVIVPFSIDIFFIGRSYSTWVYLGIITVLVAMIIAVLSDR